MISEKGQLYARQMEQQADEYFNKFNSCMKFFKTQDEDIWNCSIIDKHLVDRKGRKIAIEFKIRLCDINTYDSLFIEAKKWEAFKKDYADGHIPLYINFLRDGNHVWICDLRQFFDKQSSIEKKTLKINNHGYGRTDIDEVRYLIPQRTGIYYEFENNGYIRRW